MRHVAFAFNFTDIPTGVRFAFIKAAIRGIDSFVVFSKYEKALYQDVLGIPGDRIHFLHWAMDTPTVAPTNQVQENMRRAGYVCAIGGEGRDYEVLADALRLTPQVHCVVVARPRNLAGIDVPANMTVFTNLPTEATWRIAVDSVGMVLPLKTATTACGHITLVGAQLSQIPLAITRSRGVEDYVSEDTAYLVQPRNAVALAAALVKLSAPDPYTKSMTKRALAEARDRSNLARWVRYFSAQTAALGSALPTW